MVPCVVVLDLVASVDELVVETVVESWSSDLPDGLELK